MLREKEARKQIEYEIVLLDELVPQDHILRKIEAAVDFSFIHDLCKEQRLGHLPKYMGLDAGYHSAWVAHLLETNHIQGVIGYRRHTHKTEHYGKYRFKYDWDYDVYTCPEKKPLYWKTTTRQGYRQYFCDSKTCSACGRREECFGKSMKRRMVNRHVWQDALDRVMYFTKTPMGRQLYTWRKETIERSFAEAKENHGLRFARMLGIQNMKRLAKAFCVKQKFYYMLKAHALSCKTWALLMGCAAGEIRQRPHIYKHM